jgi:hypothetical protein
MANTYSYRPYKPGDEFAINELYYRITGRRRTPAQFSWQWLEAPEGPGDMWLIEAVDDEGNVKLIGHHGVMPIAFSRGQADLLFGKTENTMVLPEYRKRILYPRFEKRFSEVYGKRYDALFSTMGPAAAIKQRKAMRYEFPVRWQTERLATNGVFSELLFLGKNFMSKVFKIRFSPKKSYESLRCHGFLKDDEAASEAFFEDFWAQSKTNFSLAPRRNRKDLAWRFFNNPYKQHLTMVLNEAGIKGYCIISLSQKLAGEAFLEDFCVQSNLSSDAEVLLGKLLNSCKMAGIYSLQVLYTDDSELVKYNIVERYRALASRTLNRFREQPEKVMPRKVLNITCGLRNVGWDITPIVLEGRS